MNLKKTKDANFNKESGITLIALVITIIVLLILAGVSISTLVGDDGIIAKAQSARTANDIAKEKEAISLAVVSARVGNDSNIKVNADKLKEGLESLKSDGTIQDYEDPTADGVNEIKVTGATGTVYTISLAGGTITQTENTDDDDDDSTAVATEDIVLGTVVSNYVAQDLEWKVFYQEGSDIYLIASDYVPVSKLPVSSASMTIKDDTSTYPYNIWWGSAPTFQQITTTDATSGALSLSETLTLFKGTGYDISQYSGNSNSRAVSTLLNTSNWTSFVDSSYADYAIGGSTLGMWVASWNDKYPSDPLWCSGTGSYGYYVGTGTTTSTSSYYASLSSYEGYQNTLYYLHAGSYDTCLGYWLASPSARQDYPVMAVRFDGNVDSDKFSDTDNGLRPIVHLKSGVTLQDNGTSYTLVN